VAFATFTKFARRLAAIEFSVLEAKEKHDDARTDSGKFRGRAWQTSRRSVSVLELRLQTQRTIGLETAFMMALQCPGSWGYQGMIAKHEFAGAFYTNKCFGKSCRNETECDA